jgi:hypothetical protein
MAVCVSLNPNYSAARVLYKERMTAPFNTGVRGTDSTPDVTKALRRCRYPTDQTANALSNASRASR